MLPVRQARHGASPRTITGMVTKIGGKRRQHLYVSEWRESKGLTVERVGERLGVDRVTVWRWETQQNRLNPEKLAALAHAIGCEPEDFWRPPERPSLDALVKQAPDDLYRTAYDVVSRLTKQAS